MKTIDNLIFDALAERRGVVLPGIGSLGVKRVGARKISETELAPPYNDVVFTSDESGTVDVVSMVVADGTIDGGQDEAAALYGSWLEGVRRDDGSLEIDGVGRIANDGRFTASEALKNALNPAGREIVTMKPPKRSTPWWVWAAAAVVLAALAVFCCFKCGLCPSKKPVVETVITQPSDPIADSLAAAQEEASRIAAAEAAARAAAGRFHIIAGSFSVASNADNFIKQIKKQHPELDPQKISHPTNGLDMVSIYSAPTRREAASKMNLYWDINLELWIFESK